MSIVKKTIESQYKGLCTISEYQPTKDPVNKRTLHTEVPVLVNQPCRLSYKTISSADDAGEAATVSQIIKLFISPDIELKPGSKITVSQNGITREYSQSGMPAVYNHHQEVMLELFKGWS